MTVARVGVEGLERLDSIISAYPFKSYRNYRALSRRLQDAVLRAQLGTALAEPSAVAFVSEGLAAAVCHRLAWDSAFWGLPMARFDCLHAGTPDRAALEAVVTACLEACREDGVRHVAARVDIADTMTCAVLEDHGFRLMDSLVTYLYHPRQGPPPPPKGTGIVRLYQSADAEQILDITRGAFADFRGRFHADPHLPLDQTRELYVEWARRACSREMAEVVLVADNGQGDLFGWTSFRRIEPISSVSAAFVYGGGLGACRRDKPGAYARLIHAAIEWIQSRDAITECQTQNHNFATVRVYESVKTHFVRGDYTFHAWLGDTPA
jgi:L-amino acid N-acyltransferase YncA